MAIATSNLRAATAARVARMSHVGLLGGTEASPGAELTGSPYARQPITWPTGDTDGDWTGADVDVPLARTAAPTLIGYFTAATGGELVEWTPLESPAPTGVDVIRVTPQARTTAA